MAHVNRKCVCHILMMCPIASFADPKQRVERELADAALEAEGGGSKASVRDSDTDSEDDEMHKKGMGTLNELELSIYSLNASVSSLDASVVLAEVST